MSRVLLGFDFFARYTAGLTRGLTANGWQAALLYHDHDHAFGGEQGGLERYLAAQLPGVVRFPVRGRVRELGELRGAARAARSSRAWRPDVVHIQLCLPNDPRLVVATPLRRGRFALTVHDVAVHPGDPVVPLHKRLQASWLIRNAGVLFVHSETQREPLVSGWQVRAPIVVVPHGVELEDGGPLPQAPALLFFGRLSEYKGLDVLLDAMPAIWAREPATTLTIAGAGPLPASPLFDDARVRLRHEHVPDDEVPTLFRDASLVVLPYVEASQSGVGSLAKGYRRPLLVSDAGGLPELVADGSGVVAAAGDAPALADAATALLGDRERLERLAAAAAAGVAAESGWDAVAVTTIDAYERHLLPATRHRRSPVRA